MMTNEEIQQAIRARINGVWDDPALLKFGTLSTDTASDIQKLENMLADRRS